jgi:hypothetical protein
MYHLGCKIPEAYLNHVSAVALAGMSRAQYQHRLLLIPVKKNYILHITFLYINYVTICLVLDSTGLHHFFNFHKYDQIKPTTQLLQLITIKLTVIIRLSTNIHTNIFYHDSTLTKLTSFNSKTPALTVTAMTMLLTILWYLLIHLFWKWIINI